MASTIQQLNDAIQARDNARAQIHAATTRTARREADETLDYWVGKVAMLTVMAQRGVGR